MRFFNQFLLGCLSFFIISSPVQASLYKERPNPIRMGMSFLYDSAISDFLVGLDAQNENAEMGLALNVDNKKTTLNTNYTTWSLAGYIGLRRAFKPDFYGALGLQGNYGFLTGQWQQPWRVREPYSFGPYLAMEYEPKPYVQTFLRIMPYAYGRTTRNTINNLVFQQGQVGIKYFWF
jgi:hypothetical protein